MPDSSHFIAFCDSGLRPSPVLLLLAGCCLLAIPGGVRAQAPVHELGTHEKTDAPLRAPAPLLDAKSLAAPVGGVDKVRVSGFRFSGARLIAPESLAGDLSAYVGRDLSAGDLHRAAQVVADAYLRRGMMARVRIGAVSVADGVVDVLVEELRIGKVRIELPPDSRVTSGLVERFVTGRLVGGAPVSLSGLESGVMALNAQPGIAAAIAVDPGEVAGEADITVGVRNRPALAGRLHLDNHGLRELGQGRLGISLRANNALGEAEQFGIDVEESGGSQSLAPNFSLPIGTDGTRGGVDAFHAKFRAERGGAALGLKGTFNRLRAMILQPASRGDGYALNANYAAQRVSYRGDSVVGELHRRKVDSVRFGISGIARIATAVVRGNLDIERGIADLSGNSSDLAADAISSKIDGGYWRLRWSISRDQPLATGTLSLRANGQWASRNLDATQQFALGGATAVRAYPTAEALGDGGWIAGAEWRLPVDDSLEGRLFIDGGSIQRNAKPWANQRNRYDLVGLGAGATWRLPEGFRLAADAARQIGPNPGRGADNTDSDGRRNRWRLWLALSREF